MSMLNKILLFNFLFFNVQSVSASEMNFQKCQSIALVNGMKIELLLPTSVRVDRETNEIINDKNFILNGIKYKFAGMVVKLTALDHDIRMQERLYKRGIYSWYRLSNNKVRAEYLGALFPFGHTKQDILQISTLTKGSSITVFHQLYRPNFAEIYKEQGNKIIVGVSGQLLELKEIDPFIKFANPYKDDKNIWQEPFTVCKEIEWSYAD